MVRKFRRAAGRPGRFAVRTDRTNRGSRPVLEKLFSSIHLGIAFLDRNFRYLRVNDAFARAGGETPRYYPGKTHFDLFPDPEQEAIFKRVAETGRPYYAYGKTLPGFGAQNVWDWSLEVVQETGAQVESLVLVIANVTAREQSQQALRQTQALFAHMFESAPDANILVDGQGKIVSANRKTEVLFGYEKIELIGMPVEELVPDAVRAKHVGLREGFMNDPRARPMAAVKSHRLELYARRRDGTTFPTEIVLSPLKTENGVLVLSVVRDISERKQYEKELAEKNELVRLLQDIAMAANETQSVQKAFQFAIDRICQHLLWPVGHAFLTEQDARLTSTSLWSTAMNGHYPAFRAASEAIRYRSGEGLPGVVLEERQPVWLNDLQNDPIFMRKEAAGQDGLKTGLAIPVMAGRDVVGVLEFFHQEVIPPDPRLLAVLPHIGVQLGRVVERRWAEDALRKAASQLRMVITNLPVILWVIDREGRLIMLEGQGVYAAGLPRDAIINQPILEMMTHRPDILEHIRRATQGESIHAEIPADPQPGDENNSSANPVVYETFYTPYYDENWAVDGVIGLSFDISDRKRVEAELDEVKRRLLESAENERARLGKLLHDGPLQDLYGAYYQLQEAQSEMDEGTREMAGRVLNTIQQVNATLRVICGDLRPTTLVHLGLAKAIRSHAEVLRERLAEGRDIFLDLDGGGDHLPHPLRLSLFRVYQQLIANAVQHADARFIWVRLKIEPEQILLEVQDSGKGFLLSQRWLDLVRKGQFGLASAYERVTSLQGTIDIKTQPGQGTLVRVWVPLGEQAGETRAGPK